ncbi:glucose 1-dehydrogenase [Kineococcus sp. R8]|uniref:SDR family NAD(P)-dependent oxidoreductase n=1 Tax=Kineococcus siccus TaxID=2696567 RepID=UPI001412E676|nr:SDR family NAD(P)-dependent oxidoreductase [Kineococcus siccus]NAZ81947.1 glucose 1-dehydrogenase [Kineococcus siccus]
MNIDLSGRVALVTGAGRGIGRDLVRRLAREGVTTVALDVGGDDLQALGAELTAAAGSPESLQRVCDVTDLEALTGTVQEVLDRFGRVDVLVNNAGVTATGPVDTLPEEAWRRCHDVNLTGTFLACKAVIPAMKAQRSGRIVNASSFAAIVPSVAHAAYASTKAAVAHFSRALAGELGPWGITVNAYAPGMVPTSLNGFAERPRAEQDLLLDTLTVRRWGTTEDIGNVVCFLASDQAAYITGTLIDVSGGKFATQVPRVAYDYARSDDPADII